MSKLFEDEINKQETNLNESSFDALSSQQVKIAVDKASLKNLKIKNINLSLEEKQRLIEEKSRIQESINELNRKIIDAKLRQHEMKNQFRKEYAEVNRKIAAEKEAARLELIKQNSIFKQKYDELKMLNNELRHRILLSKSEMSAKKTEINREIRLANQQLHQELSSKIVEIKKKMLENKNAALESKMQLKTQAMESLNQRIAARNEFKQKIAQKKLELRAEKIRQFEDIQNRKIEIKRALAAKLFSINQERQEFFEHKSKLKSELSLSRLQARLEQNKWKAGVNAEIQTRKSEIDHDLKEHIYQQQAAMEQEKQLIKDEIKEMNDFKQETFVISQSEFNKLSLDSTSKDADYQPLPHESIALVKDFVSFNRKGDKLLSQIAEIPSEKTVTQYLKHSFYGTMVANYKAIIEQQSFVSLEDLVILAHLIDDDFSCSIELIKERINVLQKALLQDIAIQVGKYFIFPLKQGSHKAFQIKNNLIQGERVFNNMLLFSVKVNANIQKIVDDKFAKDVSIKIVDGIIIDCFQKNVQISIYPNILV